MPIPAKPIPTKTALIGAAALALLVAGAAEAASGKLHTMQVDAPDGSVVHVQYSGDVAPHVEFVPVEAISPAEMPVMADPFAHMEQISAMMDARMKAMMRSAAMMQQQAAAAPADMRGEMPEGVHMTYYSSSTDANGCTRSVSYSSDGSGAEPKMIEAASDGCDAATPRSQAIPAKAEAPAALPDAQARMPSHRT